jgi:hypothetical protein
MTINCIITTTQLMHICFKTVIFHTCCFVSDCDINMLWMALVTQNSGQTKCVLCMMFFCSASTVVTSDRRLLLVLSTNVIMRCASSSTFRLFPSRTLTWPYLISDSLTAHWYCDFLATVLLGRLKISLSWEAEVCFGHNRTLETNWEVVWQWLDVTYWGRYTRSVRKIPEYIV